ncbi:hypothetical protein SCE1572_36295 [Sorangium cellulosum So0157-2]|uniref:Uncharacterized protein n=1 Tax=Sorangium cellulosum So0157-2 TaxID=1254432 RepID=S4Y1X7_SORCE|nr:hypothetical protein SCE1572_36295 [Sorangium cellulosum So0157-2]
MHDILNELGEGPKAKVAQQKLKRILPQALKRRRIQRDKRTTTAPASTVVDRGVGAYMGAMANMAALENSRPNRAYSLIGADPATPINAGATDSFRITLPNDAFLVYWVACNEDAANFVITSLKVAGYDVIGGSPINLASFLTTTNRLDRPGPLTGRVFDGGTTIECAVRNISDQPQRFRGLTAWMISTDCGSTKKGKPAPAILSFRSLSSGFKNIFARKGVVR